MAQREQLANFRQLQLAGSDATPLGPESHWQMSSLVAVKRECLTTKGWGLGVWPEEIHGAQSTPEVQVLVGRVKLHQRADFAQQATSDSWSPLGIQSYLETASCPLKAFSMGFLELYTLEYCSVVNGRLQ